MAIRRDIPNASDYMEKTSVTKKKTKKSYDEDPVEEDIRDLEEVDSTEEEEETKPKKKKGKKKKDSDEDRPKKKSKKDEEDVEDDEEEEDPDSLPARSSVVQRGWSAARKTIKENTTYTDDFKFEEEDQVVKFLDNEPVSYMQHWINERKSGKKSFICIGDDCPLCDDLGHKPSFRAAFSVINLSVEGNPVQILQAGSKLTDVLGKHNEDRRKGPLTEHFWALSKTGTSTTTQHFTEFVRERDLVDDWDIDPKEARAAVKKAGDPETEKKVIPSSLAVMQEVVDELS